MASRSHPYNAAGNGSSRHARNAKDKPMKLQFCSGVYSAKPNADIHFISERAMGLFSGKNYMELHMDPQCMPLSMCDNVQRELEERLKKNAQEYDKDTMKTLGTATHEGHGGWLKNLAQKAFSKVQMVGSTTLAICHITNACLSCVTLGDCMIFVYRGNVQSGVWEITQNMPEESGMWSEAFLQHPRQLTQAYIENTLKTAWFDKVGVQTEDIVVLVSVGVLDNLGQAELLNIVAKAHDMMRGGAFKDPEALAEEVVAQATQNGNLRYGKPGDMTCIVGYVCQ